MSSYSGKQVIIIVTPNPGRIETAIRAYAWVLGHEDFHGVRIDDKLFTENAIMSLKARLTPLPDSVDSIYHVRQFIAHVCIMDANYAFHPGTPFSAYQYTDGRPVYTPEEQEVLTHLLTQIQGLVPLDVFFEMLTGFLYELVLL